jgi:GT2 family glycosyltransferase
VRFFQLTDRVALVAVEHHAQSPQQKVEVLLNGETVPRPYSSIDLKLSDGSHRAVIAFRAPASLSPGAAFELCVRLPPETTAQQPFALSERPAPINPTGLLAGLTPVGAARLFRLVFDFCRTAYRLESDPRFVDAARRLAQHLPAAPGAIARIDITRTLALVAGHLPRRLGEPRSILLIGPNSAAKPGFPAFFAPGTRETAGDGGLPQLQLLVDRRALPAMFIIAVIGDHDVTALLVPPVRAPQQLLAWLRDNPAAAPVFRHYLATGIAAALASEPEGVAVLKEFQLLHPLPPRTLREPEQAVGGEIELAINADNGVFLAGWLNDPNGMIAGLRLISPFGTDCPVIVPIHRFPREDIAKLFAATRRGMPNPSGFAVFLPGYTEPAPVLQYRVELALQSGAALELVLSALDHGLGRARDAILQSIPPRHLTRDAMLHAIAPPTAALHRRVVAARKPPEVIAYGQPAQTPRADVSLIVPVYRNVEFLRAQHAALALDPETRSADLIYVLDSPEQRPALDRLLRGLYATYKMPCRLVVMPANCGFAAASNAGAALAAGRLLLPLNSDVVPAGRPWLGALVAAIHASPRIAAVGAKLLYEDDSLQHAGLYFAPTAEGTWHNHHFHKGYPRDYPEANHARAVPAVTGAAMLLRRDAFVEVGGFTEDYVIGDYEDSDLCLKLRATGYQIWYEPEAELYHFERRSMPLNSAYWRSNASEYNRVLHEGRWLPFMARLADAEIAPPRRRAAGQFKLVDGGAPLRRSQGGLRRRVPRSVAKLG